MSNKRPVHTKSFFTAGVTTTVSITLVLFLLSITIFIFFMGREISSFIRENLSVTIELTDNTTQTDILQLEKIFSESPYVKSFHFITQEEIRQELIQELGTDPEEILGYIPASNYFDIYLKSEYANPDSIQVIESTLKGQTVIKNFMYSEETLDIINENLSKISTGALLLAIILTFISFTLIRNTIRLNIYAQRFLIHTMRLVGATNSFIRRPFVLKTVGCGILASLLADIAITVLIYSLTKEFPELISLITRDNLLILYIVILLLGILITFLATISAVNKYLKMNTNNLYYI